MTGGAATAGPAIAGLARNHEALLVFDIDEVVLHFIDPFTALLESYGARLHVEDFRLTGNVRSISTGTAVSGHELDRITERLYAEQEARQRPVEGAAETLHALAGEADIVFLTAMTPSFYDHRRRLLDAAGIPYPMIATERGKGAVVAELAARWDGPIVFTDDLPPNLTAVRRSVPTAHLVHLMANAIFRPHLPPLPEGAVACEDWRQVERVIRQWIAAPGASRTLRESTSGA